MAGMDKSVEDNILDMTGFYKELNKIAVFINISSLDYILLHGTILLVCWSMIQDFQTEQFCPVILKI